MFPKASHRTSGKGGKKEEKEKKKRLHRYHEMHRVGNSNENLGWHMRSNDLAKSEPKLVLHIKKIKI